MVRRSLLSLLVVGAAASSGDHHDLRRARTKKPRAGWKGDGHEGMVGVLNSHLEQMFPKVKACSEWTAEELQNLQSRLYEFRHDGFNGIYNASWDRRKMNFPSLDEHRKHWAEMNQHAEANPHMKALNRDGHCHEAVMWLVHHVPSADQQSVFARSAVPLLSGTRHSCSSEASASEQALCKAYEARVTCADCHSGSGMPYQDPTDAPPYPDDPEHPGWNRQRRCDQNYDPPCTACEGLGGPYWGDKMSDFKPTTCEVVKQPSEVAEADRVVPAFPDRFTVHQKGSDRLVRTQNAGGKFAFYSQIRSTLWYDYPANAEVAKLRHDTFYDDGAYHWLDDGLVTEVHFQTPEQRRSNITGPMISLLHGLLGMGKFAGGCTCLADPVGVPTLGKDLVDGHLGAFTTGAVYLGRIKMGVEYLVDGTYNTAKPMIVDHYMKWFLHLFMDADPSSPTFGLPVRFYGPYSGFAVYLSVNATAPPAEVWEMACPDNGWGQPEKKKECLGKKITDFPCMNVEKTHPEVCLPWAPKSADATGSYVSGAFGHYMEPEQRQSEIVV